jgi:zeaxanthin glucosyltransferase
MRAAQGPSVRRFRLATIAALFDLEEGHLFTSFKLAKELRARGHDVRYLGLASSAPLVRRQGFELTPVFERLLGGFSRSAQAMAQVTSSQWFADLVCGEALDGVMGCVKPDLVWMLSLYYPEALVVHCRYRVPVVLWTPFCRPAALTRAALVQDLVYARLMNLHAADLQAALQVVTAAGYRFGSFKDVASLVLRMPELVAMPRALELPEMPDDPNLFYVGTGMDLVRCDEPFPWGEIAAGRYLVYCSLGSQCDLEPEVARRFFRAVLGAAAAHPEWQIILSVGRGFDPAELLPAPENVHVSRWVPQLDVLRRADLVVTHGGSGTVKESILLGVPMVVLPLMRDQFDMAQRVLYHRLGVAGKLAEITAEALGRLIGEAAADASLKPRVAAMRQRIEKEDRSSLGVDVVEAALAGASPVASEGVRNPPRAAAGGAVLRETQ